jgi:hypothetical protein
LGSGESHGTELLRNVWDNDAVLNDADVVNKTTREFETRVLAPQKTWFPTTSLHLFSIA